MKRLRSFLLAGLCVATAAVSAAQDKPLIPLPSDPSTVIITMDWRGGSGPARMNMNPLLTIRADGRVTVIDPSGFIGTKETVLSPGEIQDLLRFAIMDQDFFAFSAFDVRQAIEVESAKTGAVSGIIDSSTTVLRIKTADRDQEGSYYALSLWAQRFPSIIALGQLRSIELRLTRLVEELRAGGKPEIAAAMNLANAHLKQQYPNLPAFTSDNYWHTVQFANGRKTMQFFRDQGDGTSLVVTLLYLGNDPPKITSQFQNFIPLR